MDAMGHPLVLYLIISQSGTLVLCDPVTRLATIASPAAAKRSEELITTATTRAPGIDFFNKHRCLCFSQSMSSSQACRHLFHA
ncbi:hypothetical protein Micbo1qcDRAFT_162845 [Microdochium bolleyi]|uniref:SWIM-type domain-containing protein n=1 Tax=Microdochium bolleyi TaxID=196109 RepID=A0A136J2A8_9PEZI|nr:hypothetical protein Micbo1qcDRAFT_162845 [Microdochium bolleyi]